MVELKLLFSLSKSKVPISTTTLSGPYVCGRILGWNITTLSYLKDMGMGIALYIWRVREGVCISERVYEGQFYMEELGRAERNARPSRIKERYEA